MSIALITANIIGLILYTWLILILYQIYLAAWNKDKAKANWLLAFNSSLALSLQPLLKWLLLVIFIAGLLTLIFLYINFLMQITLVFMGD